MELTQIYQFKSIAESGNISAAADMLYITQPALTKSLQRLEGELSTLLFERRNKRLYLNAAGRIVLKFAREVHAAEMKMRNELDQLSQKSQSDFAIGTPFISLMRYVVPEYYKTQGAMNLSPQIMAENELHEALFNRTVDVIISEKPLCDQNVVSQNIGGQKTLISLPVTHPLSGKKELEFSDLQGQPFLEASRDASSDYAQGFYAKLRHYNIITKTVLVDDYYIYNQILPHCDYLALSSSISVLLDNQCAHRVYLPLKDDPFKKNYYFIFLRDNIDHVQPFLSWITDNFADVLRID